MKEIIIAAYDRDYSWIDQLDDDVKITIYRKGTNQNNPNEIYIENNVGRDVHTFFYHFANNYDNLSDYTFTSQDYFEDHVNNYIELINKIIINLNRNPCKLQVNNTLDFSKTKYYLL
jgi:hypothetical protein